MFEGERFKMGKELIRCDTRLGSRSSYLHLNNAIGKAFVTDDELERCPN